VQEAFLRFLRAVASDERIESPKAYLVTVAERQSLLEALVRSGKSSLTSLLDFACGRD
jgi:DNA-directed RNA polymerase specialized sigma24 family protein